MGAAPSSVAGQNAARRADAAAAALLAESVPPPGARQACGMVDFTVTGHQQVGLEDNTNLDRQILAIASLPWKLR
jgi:hypothetical protein